MKNEDPRVDGVPGVGHGDLPRETATGVVSAPVKTHTPGPWTGANYGQMIFAGPMMVAQIRGWGHLIGKGGGLGLPEAEAVAIQEANARLIAAAPELLDALKAIVRGYDGPTVDAATAVSSHIQAARMAIVKAEGKS